MSGMLHFDDDSSSDDDDDVEFEFGNAKPEGPKADASAVRVLTAEEKDETEAFEEEDVLPDHCFTCKIVLAKERPPCCLGCSCVAGLCLICAISQLENRVGTYKSFLTCPKCRLETPLEWIFPEQQQKHIHAYEEALLRRACDYYRVNARSLQSLDKLMLLYEKLTDDGHVGGHIDLRGWQEERSIMRSLVARIEVQARGNLPELLQYQSSVPASIHDAYAMFPLGPWVLLAMHLAKNSYLLRALSVCSAVLQSSSGEDYDADDSILTTCLTCYRTLREGGAARQSCSCVQHMCMSCVQQSISSGRETYHAPPTCPSCRGPHYCVRSKEEVAIHESDLIASARAHLRSVDSKQPFAQLRAQTHFVDAIATYLSLDLISHKKVQEIHEGNFSMRQLRWELATCEARRRQLPLPETLLRVQPSAVVDRYLRIRKELLGDLPEDQDEDDIDEEELRQAMLAAQRRLQDMPRRALSAPPQPPPQQQIPPPPPPPQPSAPPMLQTAAAVATPASYTATAPSVATTAAVVVERRAEVATVAAAVDDDGDDGDDSDDELQALLGEPEDAPPAGLLVAAQETAGRAPGVAYTAATDEDPLLYDPLEATAEDVDDDMEAALRRLALRIQAVQASTASAAQTSALAQLAGSVQDVTQLLGLGLSESQALQGEYELLVTPPDGTLDQCRLAEALPGLHVVVQVALADEDLRLLPLSLRDLPRDELPRRLSGVVSLVTDRRAVNTLRASMACQLQLRVDSLSRYLLYPNGDVASPHPRSHELKPQQSLREQLLRLCRRELWPGAVLLLRPATNIRPRHLQPPDGRLPWYLLKRRYRVTKEMMIEQFLRGQTRSDARNLPLPPAATITVEDRHVATDAYEAALLASDQSDSDSQGSDSDGPAQPAARTKTGAVLTPFNAAGPDQLRRASQVPRQSGPRHPHPQQSQRPGRFAPRANGGRGSQPPRGHFGARGDGGSRKRSWSPPTVPDASHGPPPPPPPLPMMAQWSAAAPSSRLPPPPRPPPPQHQHQHQHQQRQTYQTYHTYQYPPHPQQQQTYQHPPPYRPQWPPQGHQHGRAPPPQPSQPPRSSYDYSAGRRLRREEM